MSWSALPPLLPVPMFGSDDLAGGAEEVLDGAEPKAVRRPLEDARVAMLVFAAAVAAAAAAAPRSACSDDDNDQQGLGMVRWIAV